LYQLPALADELVRLKVDVLVVNSTPRTLAAKNATKTIPIVFSNVADPVAVGLVDSLARLARGLLDGQVLQSNIPAYRAKISVSTCDDCVLKIDLFNGIKQ
jgi:putative tryptophan/tyrosine transport system substrate-binding protein